MIKFKNSKRNVESHIERCHSLVKKMTCESRLDFIVDLNVIQAYMKVYVMQG